MENIIVPLDYSANSDKALLYACKLFPDSNSFTLFHSLIGADDIAVKDATEDLKAHYTDIAENYSDTCQIDNVTFKISTDTIENAFSTISDQNTLIVMGTKGEDTGDNKPMGSYTASVIKNCNCSVLAIPYNTTIKPIKKIACLIDYESNIDLPLAHISKLSDNWNAEIILVHVSLEDGYFEEEKYKQYKAVIKKVEEYDNLSFEFIAADSIANGVNEFVKKNDIDLIAVLTHHYHLIERTYQKSLTRKLLFQTDIPLLVFHD